MNGTPPYDDSPWDLISAALSGSLSLQEELAFQKWLDLSPGNLKKYDQARKIWEEELNEYPLFSDADETKAWGSLMARLENVESFRYDEPVISRTSFNKKNIVINRLAAIAAVLLVIFVIGRMFFSQKNSPRIYTTAPGEYKKLSLADGSFLTLNPGTSVRLDPYTATEGRSVFLLGGEVFFNVIHRERQFFVVSMEGASIRDIGTSFTVLKTKDSVRVSVFSGKVILSIKETGEAKELSVNETLCLYLKEHIFSQIRSNKQLDSGRSPLQFDNTPLSDVIAALERQSGKRIRLDDTATAHKRFTAHLENQSLDSALQVICATLDLVLEQRAGIYILKPKDPASPR